MAERQLFRRAIFLFFYANRGREVFDVVAIALIALTGPDGQRIDVAPQAIVTLREPRTPEHFAPNVRCLLHMADGKVVMVIETCDVVRDVISEEGRE